GAGAVAGLAAASKLTGTGLLTSMAHAQQVTPEKNAVLVIFLNGGYNSVFCSADSYLGAGTFGVTGSNMVKMLGNGLAVDAPTFGTLPQYALDHMATVGIRHGITSHDAAQAADFGDGDRSYALELAAAMGGDAAIKAVQAGTRGTPGPRAAEMGVTLQTITDMKATIAALGGANDSTIPDRTIAANGLVASQTMSARLAKTSPVMLTDLGNGYSAGIDTLRKPVQ